MIRVAETSDAERIAEIYGRYVKETAITFEEEMPTVEAMASKVEHTCATYPWIVIEEKGDILGYAYASKYRERAAYRWSVEDSVYFDTRATGRGLGTVLLSALISILRAQGFAKVYAVITPPNPASVELHRKLGFSPLCRFPDTAYKLGAWQSIDWMELSLLPPEAFASSTAPAEPEPFSSFANRASSELIAMLGG